MKKEKKEKNEKVFEDYVKSYLGLLPSTDFNHLVNTTKYHQETDDIFDLYISIVNTILGSSTLIDLSNKKEVKDFIISHIRAKTSQGVTNFMVESLYFYIEYVLIYRKNIIKDALLLKSNKYISLNKLKSSIDTHQLKLNNLLKAVAGFGEFKQEEFELIPALIEAATNSQKINITTSIEAIKTLSVIINEEESKLKELEKKLQDLETYSKYSTQDLDILISFEELREYLIENTI